MTNWYPIEEVLALLKAQQEHRWHWGTDTKLKYLTLRVDVRDGHCTIRDKDGELVDIERIRNAASQTDMFPKKTGVIAHNGVVLRTDDGVSFNEPT